MIYNDVWLKVYCDTYNRLIPFDCYCSIDNCYYHREIKINPIVAMSAMNILFDGRHDLSRRQDAKLTIDNVSLFMNLMNDMLRHHDYFLRSGGHW